MVLTLRRDPEFWRAIASHPEVAPALMGQPFEAVASLIAHEGVVPLASENGGLIFVSRCAFAKFFELHTMYRPAGWGREVLGAAKEAFRTIFSEYEAQMVFTYEDTSNWRTRAPRSFGFRPMGEVFAGRVGNETAHFQLWTLTREAWEQSPAASSRKGMH